MSDAYEPIRQRLAAATPGPWTVLAGSAFLVEYDTDSDAIRHGIRTLAEVATGYDDAEFIANAPADIARLLDDVTAAMVLAAELDLWIERHGDELSVPALQSLSALLTKVAQS